MVNLWPSNIKCNMTIHFAYPKLCYLFQSCFTFEIIRMSYVIQNIKWKVSSTNNPSMSSFKNIAQTSESRKAAKMEGIANHNTYHMLWHFFRFFLPSDFVYCLSAKVWWNALRQNNNYRRMMQAREAQQVYPSILWHYSIRYQRKGGSEKLVSFYLYLI